MPKSWRSPLLVTSSEAKNVAPKKFKGETAMPASPLQAPKVRTVGINDADLKDRDFDDLLRRAADFLKRRPSPISTTHQEGTQTPESSDIEERDSDA
jgi:hypothetical protein